MDPLGAASLREAGGGAAAGRGRRACRGSQLADAGIAKAVAVSQDDDGWAPPVILARELWGELFALTGDAGARQVLQGRPELLDIVPAPGRPDDIDTPDDYAKIVRLFPRRRPRQRA